ncbi:MAG: ChaN family lipoprotein [Gemmatimonas sp.]
MSRLITARLGAIACVLMAAGFLPRLLSAQTNAAPAARPAETRRLDPLPSYVPNRVYDARKKKWIDFETLVQRVNALDLVFVGEQHDTEPVQALELALLEGIARRRAASGGPVVLSMEMFERDVQPRLDAYLAGSLDEVSFLRESRPWPRYITHYRPLVEIAKERKWPVVAANVPRPLASAVARGSLSVLDTLNRETRAQQVAAQIACPDDRYAKLFKEWFGSQMSAAGHGVPVAGPNISADSAKKLAANADAVAQRYYESQCVKDETMGESIARALEGARARGPGALVVHVNGSFHSDYTLGTADRALRRVKNAKHAVIKIVPTLDIDGVDAKAMRKFADYLVFTVGKPE